MKKTRGRKSRVRAPLNDFEAVSTVAGYGKLKLVKCEFTYNLLFG
jgi:hypothetical protein